MGDQEGASSFATLQCYRINFSQAHSIGFNTSSVKEGQSSPLGWPSEKKCVLGKLMKWKVLHYAAKSPCHVSTRTAGCDSDSVFMSDACVRKGVLDSQYLSRTCVVMHSLKSTFNTPLVPIYSPLPDTLFHYVWPYISLSPWDGDAHTKYPNQARLFLDIVKCHSQTHIDSWKI